MTAYSALLELIIAIVGGFLVIGIVRLWKNRASSRRNSEATLDSHARAVLREPVTHLVIAIGSHLADMVFGIFLAIWGVLTTLDHNFVVTHSKAPIYDAYTRNFGYYWEPFISVFTYIASVYFVVTGFSSLNRLYAVFLKDDIEKLNRELDQANSR